MGEEIGKVTKVSQGQMTIQLSRGDHCNVCAAKSLCSFEGPNSAYRFLNIPSVSGINEGNQVTLEYRESSRILSAMLVFLLPLLFLVAGYFLADWYFDFINREIVGAVAGLVLSGVVLFLLNRILTKSRFFLPKVLKKNHN